MRLFNPASFLFIILALAACGGGGDGSDSGSGGGGNTNGGGGSEGDTGGSTLPEISSVSPEASATDVPRDSVILAHFNKDILASTINSSSFMLTNTESVSGSVSFDGSTNTASFTPEGKLPMLTPHTATLSTAITDLEGNALASDFNWSFTTADGQWQNIGLIETNDAGHATAPRVSVDRNGNAIAVWAEPDSPSSGYFVWASRYDMASGSWTTPIKLDVTTKGSNAIPSIDMGMDNEGNAIVAWNQTDGLSDYGTLLPDSIWSRRYTVDSGWLSAEKIDNSDTFEAVNPRIAMNSNGIALVVWSQKDETDYQSSIWFNRYAPGSGWNGAMLIENSSEYAVNPRIAMDPNGNAIAIWQQRTDALRMNLWANRYEAGTGWDSASLIENDDRGDVRNHQIAVGSNGQAIAIWQQSDATRFNIRVNHHDANGWSGASNIETGDGDTAAPQIALDISGNAIAVWSQYEGTNSYIWINRYGLSAPVDNGRKWGTANKIESNAGNAIAPQITIDNNGNALTIWHKVSGPTDGIWVSRFTANIGWGNPRQIKNEDAGSVGEPQIATASNSIAAQAVWKQYDSAMIYQIVSKRLE